MERATFGRAVARLGGGGRAFAAGKAAAGACDTTATKSIGAMDFAGNGAKACVQRLGLRFGRLSL